MSNFLNRIQLNIDYEKDLLAEEGDTRHESENSRFGEIHKRVMIDVDKMRIRFPNPGSTLTLS